MIYENVLNLLGEWITLSVDWRETIGFPHAHVDPQNAADKFGNWGAYASAIYVYVDKGVSAQIGKIEVRDGYAFLVSTDPMTAGINNTIIGYAWRRQA